MDPLQFQPLSAASSLQPWFSVSLDSDICATHGCDDGSAECCASLCSSASCADTTPTAPLPPPESECFTQPDGSDYRGTVSHTHTGAACVAWADTTAFGFDASAHPFSGLDGNYCRLPIVDGLGAGPDGFAACAGLPSYFCDGLTWTLPWCFTASGEAETCGGCTNSCSSPFGESWANDGFCDDGGLPQKPGVWEMGGDPTSPVCGWGSDCADCGARTVTPSGAAVALIGSPPDGGMAPENCPDAGGCGPQLQCAGSMCDTSCDGDGNYELGSPSSGGYPDRYLVSRGDGVCEDGGDGATRQGCARGSDCVDCGPRASAGPWSSHLTAASSDAVNPTVAAVFSGLLADGSQRYLLTVRVYPTGFASSDGGSPYVVGTHVGGGFEAHGACYPGTPASGSAPHICATAVDVTCGVDAEGMLRLSTLALGNVGAAGYDHYGSTLSVAYALVAVDGSSCRSELDDALSVAAAVAAEPAAAVAAAVAAAAVAAAAPARPRAAPAVAAVAATAVAAAAARAARRRRAAARSLLGRPARLLRVDGNAQRRLCRRRRRRPRNRAGARARRRP